MTNKARSTSGKFVTKSEVPRKVRSVNLTDDAWQWLAAVAEQAGMSRNDYLEALAESGNPFIETAEFQVSPFIEMVKAKVKTDDANTVQQPNSDLSPFIEVEEAEQEEARADYTKLLESSTVVANKLKQELAEVRSQLETERADREQLETELADLKQNSVTASQELPEVADLLNRLKARRKKSKMNLADMEMAVELFSGILKKS